MKRCVGVTLIELIMVMLLIAIIAAISAPVFTSQLKQARRNEGINTVQTILTAAKDYYLRHERSFSGSNLKNIELDLTDVSPRWDLGYRVTSPNTISITATGKQGTKYAGLKINLYYQPGQEPKITDENGKSL